MTMLERATEYQREILSERKKRLARMSAARLKALDDLNTVISEQFALVAEIGAPEAPDSVAAWVKRQKARNAQLRKAVNETGPTVSKIQSATADYFNTSVIELLSARRQATTVYHRQVAMYLCKTITPRSFPDIGSRFGGRDHTTVIHAVRKIERRIKQEWEVAYDVTHIEAALAS
jgi:hypothetical protein